MKSITIEVEDLEWEILEHGIVDPAAWIQNATNVKIRKITNRIVIAEQERLIADPAAETIPATVEGIVRSHLSQDGYVKASERITEETLP